YGLRDEALDQMLMTTGYREVTLQYRAAIKRVQDAFCNDMRLRIISMPSEDEEPPLWPHMAWMPLWSNRDTCVLVADPLQPQSRHNIEYLIPLGYAQHFAHTEEDYPYYMPINTPEMVLPPYLECHPIRLSPISILNPRIPHDPTDSDPTIYSLTLEVILRLRAYLADQLLIERGYTNGVSYQHTTLLYELPLPAYLEAAEEPWALSFLLIDTARAIITLGQTNYLTWGGLNNLIEYVRNRLQEFDRLVGIVSPHPRFLNQFDQIHQYFANIHQTLLRAPSETNEFIYELSLKAGIIQEED
ncbi:MAG: hypothetical protein ACFFCJ_08945, partial [Promethearchaeota archaeon]